MQELRTARTIQLDKWLKKRNDSMVLKLLEQWRPGKDATLIVYVLLFAMAALAVVTFTGYITESSHRRAHKR